MTVRVSVGAGLCEGAHDSEAPQCVFFLPSWTRSGSQDRAVRQQVAVANRCTLVTWFVHLFSEFFGLLGRSLLTNYGPPQTAQNGGTRVAVAITVGWRFGLCSQPVQSTQWLLVTVHETALDGALRGGGSCPENTASGPQGLTEFHLLKPDSTSCAYLLGEKEFFFRNSAKNDKDIKLLLNKTPHRLLTQVSSPSPLCPWSLFQLGLRSLTHTVKTTVFLIKKIYLHSLNL